MGPQLVRCGMCVSCAGPPRRNRTFNGAATCSLRNDRMTPAQMEALHTFNGAATCSLRNVYQSYRMPSKTSSFNGAATCSLRNAVPRDTSYDTPKPFNGAATCSLRNVAEHLGCAGGTVYLQWGRNLFVAECLWGFPLRRALCQPSMGPQLVRCGMMSLPPLAHVPNVLQWGRNLFVAECGHRAGRRHCILPPSMGPQLVRCGMP